MLGRTSSTSAPQGATREILGASAIVPLQNAVAGLAHELKVLKATLDLHLRLAKMRFSYEQNDSNVCKDVFLRQLNKLSRLEGKKFEELARCSKRMLVALERTQHQEEIEEILHKIELGSLGES